MKFYIDTNGNYYTPSRIEEMILDGETPLIKAITNAEIDLLEEIANYLNENGRFFTETEMEQNILDYYCELQTSKVNHEPTHTIQTLLKLITYDDGYGDEWKCKIEQIVREGDDYV